MFQNIAKALAILKPTPAPRNLEIVPEIKTSTSTEFQFRRLSVYETDGVSGINAFSSVIYVTVCPFLVYLANFYQARHCKSEIYTSKVL